MDKADTWYMRNEAGQIFGPVGLATLVTWAKDGRIEPSAAISADRQAWTPATLKPELDMTWVAEAAPGQFYGPCNRAVVDGLLKAGSLPAGIRLYHCDRGEAAARIKDLEAAVAARDAALAELPRRAAEQAEATKKTLSFLESRLAALHDESEKAVADAAARVAAAEAARDKAAAALVERDQAEAARGTELAALRASLDAADERVRAAEAERDAARSALASREAVWKTERATMESERASLRSEQTTLQSEMSRTERSAASLNGRIAALERELAEAKAVRPAAARPEVVEPEVVVAAAAEPPPAPARPAPSPAAASLADLERQAQRELARMGASGHGFFARRRG